MGGLIATRHGERSIPGAGEMLAAMVRELMADRRAQLASEDAPRREAPDPVVLAPASPLELSAHA